MRFLWPVAFVLVFGCVDKGPSRTQKQIDPAYIQKNLLSEPPAQLTNTVNADIGTKVVYLGNDMDAEVLTPGQKVKVVHYWKVLAPPGERWRVFTHLIGDNPKDWLNLDYTDMRQGHGPGTWKAGEIIRDEQEFQLPDSWISARAKMVVGLYPRGGHTIGDRMPVVSGPHDDESRVPVLSVRVERKAQKPDPAAAASPGYVIRKAGESITIDGRADEAAWTNAAKSPLFTDAQGSPAMAGDTTARLLWDERYLYLLVESQDADVYSQYRKHDDPLWKEDVVEIFIDADRNGRGYVELQVNPNNVHFDAWFATTRAAASDVAWNAAMTSAVNVRGTADNRNDKDSGWDAEIAIPWAAVRGKDERMAVSLPPLIGNIWRLNVVRIDKPRDGSLAAASWNPITYQDFHALDRMLEVHFGDAEGNITPVLPDSENPPAGQPDDKQPADKPSTSAQPASTQPADKPSTGTQPADKPSTSTQPADKPSTSAQPASTPSTDKQPAAKAE